MSPERTGSLVTGEERTNKNMFSNDIFGRIVLSEQKTVQTRGH